MAKCFGLSLESAVETSPKFIGDLHFDKVLDHLNKHHAGEFLPLVTFSELQTQTLCIRTVLLPESDGKRFFYLGVNYKFVNEDGCKGIIERVTDSLPFEYKIWHSYNYTVAYTEGYEIGNLVFLLEDITNARKRTDGKVKEDYVKEAIITINTIIAELNAIEDSKVTYSNERVISLPEPENIKHIVKSNYAKRKKKSYLYDIFISYSAKDSESAAYLKEYLYDKHKILCHMSAIDYGERINVKLLKNILDSREICMLISNNSKKSEWVHREFGAAWALDKYVTPAFLRYSMRTNMKNMLKGLEDSLGFVVSTEGLDTYAHKYLERKRDSELEEFPYFRK